MDASDLRIFRAAARLGSIGRAAAELHTVQSNATARIQLLEEDLGAKLFARHSRGVTLTPAGRRLLPYAERAATLFEEARRAVADDGEPAGPLAIGSLETTAALRLPELLSRFAKSNPAVDLTLTTSTSACLIRDVLEHRLDAAFVVGPVRHPELDEELVFREELVLVTAVGIGGVEQLRQTPGIKIVVFRSGCTYRHRLEAFLAARGLVGVRQLEFGTLGGIIGCVAAGIGVSLLPRAVIADDLREGRVAAHDLPPADARADTVLIARSDAPRSSACWPSGKRDTRRRSGWSSERPEERPLSLTEARIALSTSRRDTEENFGHVAQGCTLTRITTPHCLSARPISISPNSIAPAEGHRRALGSRCRRGCRGPR